jgi:hypothetical protein
MDKSLRSAGTSGPAVSPPRGLAARINRRERRLANDGFYRIDINTRPPVVGEAEWRLRSAGW